MATDRLRRKVRDISSDTLSTLTSNLCIIGTPLPALYKKDSNELKPIWQQEARDEQGRRRFHGAFTGGWSAGYYNTVGSKEGWVPGSFHSTRKDRQRGDEGKKARDGVGSRVEDFMDEEDLEDWKQAQVVQASSSFDGINQIAGLRDKSDPLASTLFGGNDIALATNGGAGYKLLQRMGWKPGQGLGPRVDAKKKARLLSLVSTGSETIATSSDVTLDDVKSLYDPPPTPLPPLPRQSGSRKGLGAQDTPTLAQALASSRNAPSATSDTQDVTAEEDVWPDGRAMLPDFHLARQSHPPEPSFPASPVPPGWQPDPSRVWRRYAPQLDSKAAENNPSTRGELLGEAKIPGPPPNIAAFLSAKARERLAAESNAALPSPASVLTQASVECPRLDPATAKQALEGFAPFSAIPAKQGRYAAYLKTQLESGSRGPKRLQVPHELTPEQYTNELKEFVKSATIFRSMSSAIASRFTTASAAVMEHETRGTSSTPGLRQPAPASASTDVGEVVEAENKLSTAQQAAKMGNFGHLTRTVEAWAPERLLCKRFGVREPAVSRQRGEEQTTSTGPVTRPDVEDGNPFYSSKSSKSNIAVDQHWERNKAQLKALAAGPTPLSLDAQLPLTTETPLPSETAVEETVGLGEDDRQGHDTLSYVKPPLDVYKSIFASDEEDSDHEPAPKSKMRNPAAGAGVVFQARSKRNADAEGKTASTGGGEKKRRKDKSTKKALLTFDFDDGDADEGVMEEGGQVRGKQKAKGRVRASDLF